MNAPLARADAWVEAVTRRHTGNLSRPEFLKAVRALSARYVERRQELPRRSPTDSAGKRAAFAGFFAPLHFVVARAVVEATGAGRTPLDTLLELGCGTGTASAAWATSAAQQPTLAGVDKESWALDEAAWNWRELGLHGRTERGDMTTALKKRLPRRGRCGILLAWSLNELDDRGRGALTAELLEAADAGASVLVIEPLARTAVPWWEAWTRAWQRRGARVDAWKFTPDLPPALATISEEAGFRRDVLGARSMWCQTGMGRETTS